MEPNEYLKKLKHLLKENRLNDRDQILMVVKDLLNYMEKRTNYEPLMELEKEQLDIFPYLIALEKYWVIIDFPNLNWESKIRKLSSTESEQLIFTLITSLRKGDTYIRNWAGEILVLIGDTAVPYLLHCLADESAYIRGKCLGLLGNIMKKTNFQEEFILDRIISRVDDVTNWVREVAIEMLRQWGVVFPKKIFQKLRELFTQSFESLKIVDLLSGISAGEHIIRLLFELYLRFPDALAKEFVSFTEQLIKMYDANKSGNAFKILEYFASYIDLGISGPWDPASREPACQCCWTCIYWKWQQVPKEELKYYLESQDYKELAEGMSIEMLDDTYVLPLNPETGTFQPIILRRYPCLSKYGYCVKLHKLTSAETTTTYYSPRKLSRPLSFTVLELNGRSIVRLYMLIAGLDGLMRTQLEKALRILHEHNAFDLPKFFDQLKLPYVFIDRTGSCVSYETLISEEKWDGGPDYIFQGHSETLLMSDQGIYREEEDLLSNKNLEQILNGKIYCYSNSFFSQSEISKRFFRRYFSLKHLI